jgi:hypothetical protein
MAPYGRQSPYFFSQEREMNTVSILVTFSIPEGSDPDDLTEYVKDALSMWCKSYDPPGGGEPDSPGDPLFCIDENIISISQLGVTTDIPAHGPA